MIVVRDYDLMTGLPSNEQLGLHGKQIILDGSIPVLKEQDAVCFLTALRHGGKRYQTELLRQNPGVKRWVVVLFTNDTVAAAMYRERLKDVKSPVECITADPAHPEALIKALRPIGGVTENSCLLYTRENGAGLRELAEHLRLLLPGWTFREETGSPACLSGSGCAKIIIAGNTPEDFDIALPEELVQVPLFVLMEAERSIQLYLHPAGLIRQITARLGKGRGWSEKQVEDHFFAVSVLYEQLYRRYGDNPKNIPALFRDSRFTVWDSFGLPQRQSECDALAFLRGFTGGAELASHLTANER